MNNSANYVIYQLKENDENKELQNLKYSKLAALGKTPEYDSYFEAFSGKWNPHDSFLDLIVSFNQKLPLLYRGRPLEVSDIVVIEAEDNVSAYYINNVGYVDCPGFAKQYMLKTSAFRDNPVYIVNASDVFEALNDLDMLDELNQTEIRELVNIVKKELSLDWYDSIQAIVENHIAEKEYDEKRTNRAGDR